MPNTMSSSNSGLPYLPGLDGLRALAVLVVFSYHAQVAWAVGGFLGVESFFVISGYLITSLLVREHLASRRVDLGRFWRRRARRLLPALWLVLAAAAPLAALWAPDALARLGEDIPAALLYATNWLFIVREIPYFEQFGRPPLLQHLWSLAVEEQFYLVWPLVMWLAVRALRVREAGQVWRLGVPILISAVAASLWTASLYDPLGDPARVYYGTDTRAAGFLLGAALATFWTPGRRPGRAGGVVEAAGLGGLVGLAWAFTHLNEYDSFLYRGGLLMVAALTGLVIAAAACPNTRLAQVLGSPVLRWIGARSYGIYLWHWPIMVISGWGPDPLLTPGVVTALQLVATFTLAELSYRWVEQPIRQAGWRPWLQGLQRRWGALQLSAGSVAGLALLVGVVTVQPAWALGQTDAPATASARPSQSSLVRSPATAMPAPTASATTTAAPLEPDPIRELEAAIAVETEAAVPPTATPSQPTPMPSVTTTSIAATLAVIPAVAVATSEPQPTAPPAVAAAQLQVTLIGDSVMAGAASRLEKQLAPGTYALAAQPQRRMGDALTLIPELAAEGKLASTVVIHLGTNQPFDDSVFDGVMQSLVDRGATRVIFLTVKRPITWESYLNRKLAEGVARWPQAELADWNAIAQSQPGWFIADQVHPTTTGAEAYVSLILQALGGY